MSVRKEISEEEQEEQTRWVNELLVELHEEDVMKGNGVWAEGGMVRVEIKEDGSYYYTNGNYASVRYSEEDLPDWIRESINILMVLDHQDTIPGIGTRYNDNVFYLDRQENVDGG